MVTDAMAAHGALRTLIICFRVVFGRGNDSYRTAYPLFSSYITYGTLKFDFCSDRHLALNGRGSKRSNSWYVKPVKLLRICQITACAARRVHQNRVLRPFRPLILKNDNSHHVDTYTHYYTTYSAHDLHHYPRDTNGIKDSGW